MSSEQEASSMPEGSHLIALTSFCQTQDSLVEPLMERESYTDTWTPQKRLFTVWPWKVLRGRSLPRRHTWMHMSVLHEAKVELFCQSTSSAGAVEYFKMHTAALMRRFLWPRDNHSWTGKKKPTTSSDCTWVKRELLFGFACVCVPNDCRLEN